MSPLSECDTGYAVEVAQRALALAIVDGGPVVPGALCRGQAPGWDSAGVHRTRTTPPPAVTICRRCPEQVACARWAEQQQHLTGIYAGQLYRPDDRPPKVRKSRPRRRTPIPHGSNAGYGAGCLCARCRAAHNAECRAWRRAQIPLPALPFGAGQG